MSASCSMGLVKAEVDKKGYVWTKIWGKVDQTIK